jgi:hypothetical protein
VDVIQGRHKARGGHWAHTRHSHQTSHAVIGLRQDLEFPVRVGNLFSKSLEHYQDVFQVRRQAFPVTQQRPPRLPWQRLRRRAQGLADP